VTNELDDPAVIDRYLRRWLAGPPFGPSELDRVRRLPGHAGTTYAVGATRADGDVEFVIKLPPPGAKRSGNTDVLRQARVLRLVHGLGLRAPAVLAAGDEHDGPFGVPFVVTELVPGSSPGDAFDPGDPPGADGTDVTAAFGDAIDELTRLHAVPASDEVTRVLGERSLSGEVEFWDPALAKAESPAWIAAGRDLGRRLLATMPADTPRGIIHGDYYSNNWLFVGSRLTAAVDWENTVFGPRLVDLGWVCMMYDPGSWGPMRQPTLGHTPSPAWMADRYAARRSEGIDQLPWFRAHGGYRLACLTAYYLRLHRTGKRPDPIWEVFGDGFMPMIERAHQLLDHS
jgi:aminoglycoside phosphotransferase (APT) family kinase protein